MMHSIMRNQYRPINILRHKISRIFTSYENLKLLLTQIMVRYTVLTTLTLLRYKIFLASKASQNFISVLILFLDLSKDSLPWLSLFDYQNLYSLAFTTFKIISHILNTVYRPVCGKTYLVYLC